MRKDYYLILGVGRGADLDQIKQAYRTIVKTCHPDLAVDPDADRFRQIQEAYETLSDQDRRRRYDADLGPKSETPRARPRKAQKPKAGPMEGCTKGTSFDLFETGGPDSESRDLYFEVVLDPEEAVRGCLAPIRFPVQTPCPACFGEGYQGTGFCPACGGRGLVKRWSCVSVAIPPQTVDGAAATFSLDAFGLPGGRLNLVIRVEESRL
jgi:molecular chaperone DnaJ